MKSDKPGNDVLDPEQGTDIQRIETGETVLAGDENDMSAPENPQQAPRSTCVLVLGMHRSGTSALSGVLSLLGCELPSNQMQSSVSNAKGFFESTKIRDFNDELLASAGSSWDDFQEFNPLWLASPAAEHFFDLSRDVLKAEFGNSRLIVLKDPRICRLLPFWMKALDDAGYDVKPILIQRNPLEVSRSINIKKGYGNAFNQMLWLRHVLDAEAFTRGMDRTHTSFEQLIQGWELVAQQTQNELKLRWPRSLDAAELDIENFLSSQLRHHQEPPTRVLDSPLLTDWLRDTYKILMRWTENGESSKDFKALDRIRAELNAASGKFGRVVRSEREIAEKFRQQTAHVQQQLTEQSRTTEKLRQEVQRLTGEIDSLKTRLSEQTKTSKIAESLREQIRKLTGETDTLKASLETQTKKSRAADELRTKLESQTAELEMAAGWKRDLEEARSNLDQKNTEIAELSEQFTTLQDQLQDRFAELAGLVGVITEHERQVALLTKDRDALRSQYSEKEALLQHTEHEVHSLRNSTSWKLTKPLRKVMSLARRNRSR